MKIFCIGLNYAKHIEEMKSFKATDPVIFSKPETALLKNNAPFYYPDFSNNIHHETELVIRINKPGKNIKAKFAHKYYDEIGIGIDFTARDIQMDLKKNGHPWDKSKGFDGAAPVSKFINKKELNDLNDINFHMNLNGNTVQKGNTKDLINSFDEIIEDISKYFTLKKGDFIFTGTPEGVGPVAIGDRIEAYIEDEKMLNFNIK